MRSTEGFQRQLPWPVRSPPLTHHQGRFGQLIPLAMWGLQWPIFCGVLTKIKQVGFHEAFIYSGQCHKVSMSRFYYHRQSVFVGLFDKLLENIFFPPLWKSLWRLFRCLTSRRFVSYLSHHCWPGLDSPASFRVGSRKILPSRDILLIFHFPSCLMISLGSVSSLNAYLCMFRINQPDASKPRWAQLCFPPSS